MLLRKKFLRWIRKLLTERSRKRLAKAIADEDKGLNNFGIAEKVQKIMSKRPKKKKDKKQTQNEEEEEELIAKERTTKKRHE